MSDRQPLIDVGVIPCLRCGIKGKHTKIAYASSRAYTETGKVCDDCYKALEEEMHDRGWYVWPRDCAK